ncbi:hypothetical protein IMSHALPRED_001733, partial [Imshaugia aleurites]
EPISCDQVENIILASTIVGSAVPSQEEKEYWLTQQRLLGHADRCIRFLQRLDTPDETGYSGSNHAFHNLGLLPADQGKLAEAEKMYERALEAYEKALGPEHKSTLDTVNNLGLLYADQGKLAERTSTLSKIRAFFTKLRARWRRRMSKGKRRS